jgi:hypothetical protein
MQFRSLISALFLSFAVAVASGPAAAQPGAEGPPGLFKGAGEAGPQAMNAVGQKRMATLKQDSTTQSIRLVRIAGNLSQRRTLVMHVGANRALAPEVPPTFQREHPGRGGAEKPGRGRGNQKTKLFIRRDEINAIEEGIYAWKGTVHLRSPSQGNGKRPVGTVTLVRGADGDITGTIRVESEYYLVRPLDSGSGLHALVEEDESAYSIGSASPRNYGESSSKSFQSSLNAASVVRSSQSSESSAEQTCRASTGSLTSERAGSQKSRGGSYSTSPCSQLNTDVLVVYTSNAADGRDIDGIINTAIQEANDSYDNSDTYNTDLTLVHSQQVDFGLTGDIGKDVDNLTTNGAVNSLRNEYDADVVVLLTPDIYGTIKGEADEVRAEEEDAFAIVAAPTATGGQFVFTHEVGHLQGAQHRPGEDSCSPGTECDKERDLFPDAFAHQFEGDDSPWCLWLCGGTDYRTITALPGRGYTRVKHFSNPNVNHDGGQTGTGSRNNADALQTTANTVENFRISDDLRASMTVSGDPSDIARTFTASACGGTGSYSYEWRVSLDGPGNYGRVLSTSEKLFKKFPDGTHYVKLTVTSGSETAVAIRSVYVNSGDLKDPVLKSTAAQPEKKGTKAGPERPSEVALRGPVPNPIKTGGTIAYELPERTDVTLAVYDLMGRKVATLAAGARSAGTHRARLKGASLPSGTYVVRLRAGEEEMTRRITVVK